MAKYFSDKEIAGLEPRLVEISDHIRDYVGPLTITSGKRQPGGVGVKDSAHFSGLAADYRSRSWEKHFKIVEAAIRLGVRRIGVYHDKHMNPTHIHIDIDQSKPAPRLWIDISQ